MVFFSENLYLPENNDNSDVLSGLQTLPLLMISVK